MLNSNRIATKNVGNLLYISRRAFIKKSDSPSKPQPKISHTVSGHKLDSRLIISKPSQAIQDPIVKGGDYFTNPTLLDYRYPILHYLLYSTIGFFTVVGGIYHYKSMKLESQLQAEFEKYNEQMMQAVDQRRLELAPDSQFEPRKLPYPWWMFWTDRE